MVGPAHVRGEADPLSVRRVGDHVGVAAVAGEQRPVGDRDRYTKIEEYVNGLAKSPEPLSPRSLAEAVRSDSNY